SHVCRHWRDVALNDPALWKDLILPLPPQWADAIIARSRGAPLSLSGGYYEYTGKTSDTWLPIDSLENVYRMDLSWEFGGSPVDLARVLSSPAPLLEDIRVAVNPLVTLSTPLFANHAPRLRKLEIARIGGLSWTSSPQVLRNLVSMHVSCIAVPPPCSATEFIFALQQLSRVEDLELYGCFPSSFSSTSRPLDASQIAHFPSLRQLEILGKASECVGFLHHVRTPSTATLSIKCYGTRETSVFTGLFPFLAPARGVFRCVRLVYGNRDFQIEACHDAWCDPSDRQLFIAEDLGMGDGIISFLRALFWDVGMLRCFELDLDVVVSMTPTMWLDTFGVAAEAQQMTVRSRGGIGFCLALSATAEGGVWRMGNGTGSGAVVWPKLQRLQLRDVDFQHRFVDDDEFGVGPEDAETSVGEVLLSALEHRQRCGARLVELELGHCGETEKWLREAEGLVERVLVSGRDEDDQSNHSGQKSSENEGVDGRIVGDEDD
ncbi:hypothetical protein FA95DRAFT_1223901, partial [Auriscalpium vulgare]